MKFPAWSKTWSSFQEKQTYFPFTGLIIFTLTAFRLWKAASIGRRVKYCVAKNIELSDKINVQKLLLLLYYCTVMCCYILFVPKRKWWLLFPPVCTCWHLLAFDFIPDANFILKLGWPLCVPLFQVLPTFTHTVTTVCISNEVKLTSGTFSAEFYFDNYAHLKGNTFVGNFWN